MAFSHRNSHRKSLGERDFWHSPRNSICLILYCFIPAASGNLQCDCKAETAVWEVAYGCTLHTVLRAFLHEVVKSTESWWEVLFCLCVCVCGGVLIRVEAVYPEKRRLFV